MRDDLYFLFGPRSLQFCEGTIGLSFASVQESEKIPFFGEGAYHHFPRL